MNITRIILPVLLYCISSCNNNNSKTETGKTVIDTAKSKTIVQAQTNNNQPVSGIPVFDNPGTFLPDTKVLKREREKILNRFFIENAPAGADYDTLVDINYDGYRDYIIGYYGASGTGFKYRIKVYMYSKKTNSYFFNSQVSDLSNPSFFIPQFKITGFYIGLGGGYGKKLEWINNKWTLTKSFEVSNENDSTVWEIYYPLKKKKEKIIHQFQVIPPEVILETNRDF